MEQQTIQSGETKQKTKLSQVKNVQDITHLTEG